MRGKAVLYPLLSMLLGTAGVLVALEVTFRLLPTCDSLRAQPVNDANPVLRFAPDREVTVSQGPAFRPRARKRVNNFGFLNDADYAPDGAGPLLAVIGDSYVEATQVTNAESVHGRLAGTLAPRARVYSFGASGAALPTYLAYAGFAARHFEPDALVVVVVGNDFDESWTKYKRAPGFHYFEGDGLDVPPAGPRLVRVDYRPSRAKRLAQRSALMRYLVLNLDLTPGRVRALFVRDAAADAGPAYAGNTSAATPPARLAAGRAAVDAFLARLPAISGVEPSRTTIAVDGLRPQVYGPDPDAAGSSYFGRMRVYLLETGTARGFDMVDLQPAFVAAYRATGQRFEFEHDAHWNATGHAVVARAVAGGAAVRHVRGTAR